MRYRRRSRMQKGGGGGGGGRRERGERREKGGAGSFQFFNCFPLSLMRLRPSFKTKLSPLEREKRHYRKFI